MGKVFCLVLMLALCFAVVSCGGSPENGSASPSFISTAVNIGNIDPMPLPEIQPRSVSLQIALSDLAELPVPTNVDQALFETMRDELEIALVNFYSDNGATQQWSKAASAVEPVTMNGAWCLDGKQMPSGEVTIQWRGNHLGDYDLNSEVNVADITPLVLHYLANPVVDAEGLPVVDGQNESQAQTDGDNNGEVNVADITQIALNYASSVVGYRLYPGTSVDGTTYTWDTEYVPNADNPGAVYSVPFNTSLQAGEIFRYSATFVYLQDPGVQLYVKVVPFDGTSEGAAQIISVPEGPHAKFDCSTCHFVTNMAFRGAEDSCHNCHSTQMGRIASSSMNSCDMCHTEHTFRVSNVVDTCTTCHRTPPDVLGGDWANAPGMHGQCDSCHKDHWFEIGEPNSVCSSCHQDKIDAGHAGGSLVCLDCHSSPHLPEIAPTGSSCTLCHLTPPENPSAMWEDAPGSHGNCLLCHTDPEHGTKPTPAESVCRNCHTDPISPILPDPDKAEHNTTNPVCLDCHIFPHLPEFQLQEDVCLGCHDNYEGDGMHAGSCLGCHPDDHTMGNPGSHETCQNCHPY